LMTTTPKLVIFTDLDGTLLDKENYSFESAQPALQLIKGRNIPLILSSSKTRAEIELYRKRLENNHPFIPENGGAIFIPEGYFSFPFPHDREVDGYEVLELGTSYSRITEVLDSIREETGISIRGFSDLSEEELASLCGLSPQEATLAKKREYDEAFVMEGGEEEVEVVSRKIEEKGLNHTRGGRFHHILGENDKGKAVEILKELYENECVTISTLGLGDGLNDLPMLLAVDHPILLAERPNVSQEFRSKIRNLTVFDGTGSRAWNEAILKFVH
jgi:mannosyl-3-phosphoglycerate phosphatase